MTTSGIGIVMINVLTSFAVGGAVGTIIAYRTRQAAWILLGPISSAILCGAMFDFAKPWEILLVSIFGPFITMLGQRCMIALGIDDPKVVPLALFNGVAAAMVAGFVGWGTKTGGFIGLKGEYGFQHAEINPWWQFVGVVAIILVSGIPALLVAMFFDARGKLRASDEDQDVGLDIANWGEQVAR